MPLDEQALAQKYDTLRLNVVSSTHISTRASAVIKSLSAVSVQGSKPTIAVLTAQAKAASKLISIVEIAKRDLAASGAECYQYTCLASRITEIEREPKTTADGKLGQMPATIDADGESDNAFETIPGGNATTIKKRLVPVITVYLAPSHVNELTAEYGEQHLHA